MFGKIVVFWLPIDPWFSTCGTCTTGGRPAYCMWHMGFHSWNRNGGWIWPSQNIHCHNSQRWRTAWLELMVPLVLGESEVGTRKHSKELKAINSSQNYGRWKLKSVEHCILLFTWTINLWRCFKHYYLSVIYQESVSYPWNRLWEYLFRVGCSEWDTLDLRLLLAHLWPEQDQDISFLSSCLSILRAMQYFHWCRNIRREGAEREATLFFFLVLFCYFLLLLIPTLESFLQES